MVNHTNLALQSTHKQMENATTLVENPCKTSIMSSEQHQEDGPFLWDHGQQTLLLASYYYGYTASQEWINKFVLRHHNVSI